MTFDLYAWKSPRDLGAAGIEALLEEWHEAGGDPATSPFEPSSDVGWFYLELTKDEPALGATSDALPSTSKTPIWLGTTPDPLPRADIGRLMAVGGTATNVARLVPAAALDRVLTPARLDAAMAALTAGPAAYVALHHAVNPLRARVLPAGVAILEAFLDRYGLRRLGVIDTGIREGAVLAASRVGPTWRDQLEDLALGWRLAGVGR